MARFLALVNMVGLLVKNPDFTVIFQALSRKVVSFLLLYFVQRKKEERICKFSTSSFYRAPISFLILDPFSAPPGARNPAKQSDYIYQFLEATYQTRKHSVPLQGMPLHPPHPRTLRKKKKKETKKPKKQKRRIITFKNPFHRPSPFHRPFHLLYHPSGARRPCRRRGHRRRPVRRRLCRSPCAPCSWAWARRR